MYPECLTKYEDAGNARGVLMLIHKHDIDSPDDRRFNGTFYVRGFQHFLYIKPPKKANKLLLLVLQYQATIAEGAPAYSG